MKKINEDANWNRVDIISTIKKPEDPDIVNGNVVSEYQGGCVSWEYHRKIVSCYKRNR